MPLLPGTASTSAMPAEGADGMYLLTFADGSVGVFDMRQGRWVYFRHGGHTETIFAWYVHVHLLFVRYMYCSIDVV